MFLFSKSRSSSFHDSSLSLFSELCALTLLNYSVPVEFGPMCVCLRMCVRLCERGAQWRSRDLFLGFGYMEREKIEGERLWWIDFFSFIYAYVFCFFFPLGHVLQLLVDIPCWRPPLYLQGVLACSQIQLCSLNIQIHVGSEKKGSKRRLNKPVLSSIQARFTLTQRLRSLNIQLMWKNVTGTHTPSCTRHCQHLVESDSSAICGWWGRAGGRVTERQ